MRLEDEEESLKLFGGFEHFLKEFSERDLLDTRKRAASREYLETLSSELESRLKTIIESAN